MTQFYYCLGLLLIVSPLISPIPHFDPTALLQNILIPADAAVNSIIFRLRASDPTISYPLVFSLRKEPTTVSINSLNCSRLNSICQANVILRKRLEPGRFYDFEILVTNQRGEFSSLNCSFQATNATTPINEIFPGAPALLMVSENARRNVELGTITARGNPGRPNGVLLELWGAHEFGLYQKLINNRDAQATIVLLGPLDYETKTMHHLTILANDPWTNLNEDTRNIAGWPLLVTVLDEQDTPPIFTLAPPTTTLSPTLKEGDPILRIHAEDGDRGKPRDIRYGLVPEGNPFTSFFTISEESGEIKLIRPLNEILAISHTGQPIILTVIAEEVRTNSEEAPAQSSTINIALIPPGIRAGTPTFGADKYSTLLDENSPVGTILSLAQAEVVAEPGNVVTLDLINNNGTFDIIPKVIEGQGKFQIKVVDPKLLDYEMWHSVECFIIAKELGSGNYSTQAKLEVLLNDVNDNPPIFSKTEYQATIQENAPVGTSVVIVEAVDIDRAPGSKIKYTRLTGLGSEFFDLEPIGGLITVANSEGLDAEISPQISFIVEAADEDGNGQTATATIVVNLVDINDEVPKFEKNVYEFILNDKRTAFTTKAFIKAEDNDLTSPNNEVHYELIDPIKNLHLNGKTGELIVTQKWQEDDIVIVKARAWDGGVPRLSSECEIRIYPPDRQSNRVALIVPGRNPNLDELKKTLQKLTRSEVIIHDVRPYIENEPGFHNFNRESEGAKTVIIVSADDGYIDVKKIQQILDQNQYSDSQKVQKSSTGNLLWLLILLIILALLLILSLILCCICQGCPLYVPPKKRKVVSSHVEKVVRGSGHGRESKSVQVAEWFGRREAWTPDNEAESLQRHEQERGSDRTDARKVRQQLQREPSRDHLYIREGNADILRLITRGNDTQRQDQAYFIADSGKDILMKRYIDQQSQSQINLPNAVNKLQTEHEILEASLKQQSALLRQILLERERDLRLETQSLPAGTQTDQDAGTQTEPFLFKRQTQSDNDNTDGSDEEIALIKARARRRHGRKAIRRIKTPIQEESEIEVIEKVATTSAKSNGPYIRQTKTSEMRQQKASSLSSSSRSAIRKEILKEITASLERSPSGEEEEEEEEGAISSDSLNEISPRSEKTTDSNKQKYHSESEARIPSPVTINKTKSQSQQNLNNAKTETNKKPNQKKVVKRASRYMEWYNKNQPKAIDKIEAKPNDTKPTETKSKRTKNQKTSSRLMQETESSSKKKVNKKAALGPEHPLLQHSEHRFEVQYPTRKPEEDTDSGIALTRLPIAQKKSVFTIAYDDMHTKQLRPESHSPPL